MQEIRMNSVHNFPAIHKKLNLRVLKCYFKVLIIFISNFQHTLSQNTSNRFKHLYLARISTGRTVYYFRETSTEFFEYKFLYRFFILQIFICIVRYCQETLTCSLNHVISYKIDCLLPGIRRDTNIEEDVGFFS